MPARQFCIGCSMTRFSSIFAVGLTVVAAVQSDARVDLCATINTSDPWLVSNGLVSATLVLTNFSDGQSIQGIIGTSAHPWKVTTGAAGFYNAPTTFDEKNQIVFDGEGVWAGANFNAGAPHGNFDSGFLPITGNSPFGFPVDSASPPDAFRFARYSSGESVVDPSVVWISLSPSGVPVNSSTQLPILRLTMSANALFDVSFVVIMNTPAVDVPVSATVTLAGPVGNCCTDSGCVFTPSGLCDMLYRGTFIGCAPCTECGPICDADIAPPGGDDTVNVGDLLLVINSWGPCPSPCAADITNDGSVDVVDLLAVITNWGPCK
jgi:hypothetical protein